MSDVPFNWQRSDPALKEYADSMCPRCLTYPDEMVAVGDETHLHFMCLACVREIEEQEFDGDDAREPLWVLLGCVLVGVSAYVSIRSIMWVAETIGRWIW